MRCSHCNYALWNLATRQCPECGQAFAPRSFEFVPGTVSFCCPHCDAAYAAPGASGHLEPPRFECRGCHVEISEDEMVLRVAEGHEEAQTRPGPMPWLERAHQGRLRAFARTARLALFRPHRLIQGVPVTASVGEGLVYAALTTALLLTVGALVPWGIWSFMVGGFGWPGLLIAWWLPMIIVAGVGAILVWAMVTHLVLRLTGECRYGIDRTLHAVSYSAGANLLTAIPCAGPYFGWLWWVASATIMLAVTQRVGAFRAALAVLTTPILICLTILGFIWLAMMPGVRSFAGAGATPGSTGTMLLGNAIESYMYQDGQQTLEHVLVLYVGKSVYYNAVSESAFCHPGSKTTPADIPVGDLTLEEVDALPLSGQLTAVAQFLDALPEEGMVAYRFGDFVFTYPGLSLAPGDPDAWIAVMLPDPDVNGVPGPSDPVYIAGGAYSVTETTFGELPVLLAEQNDYRSMLALPPLPPLETVTHDAPALAPAGPQIMNCRTCNYPLWNLRNQCPECGTPFVPSDFDFAPNRVEFRCPHCEQPYYGTDARGHLVPAAFACVSCGQSITMDETTARPAPGVSESVARPGRMPWLERGERSATGALFATIGQALVQPGRLMRAVPEGSPIGPAWRFAIVANVLTMVARLLPALCILVAMPLIVSAGQSGGGTGPGPGPAGPPTGLMLSLFGGVVGASLLVAVVILVVTLLVWPAVCHWVLVITGGAASGMRRTAQAILYASGANASSAVPCIGNLGSIWWIVSAVLMVREGQKVHGGRATLAVLVYPVLLVVGLCVAYALFVFSMMAGASGLAGTAAISAARSGETAAMALQITSYAASHEGLAPPHAAALVTEQGTAVASFVASGTETSQAAIPVGGVSLSQLRQQGVPARRATVTRAAAALPPDVVAHRLGDFVFTYHGVDLTGDASGLWIVVLCPDPDLNLGVHDAACGTFDGTFTRIPAAMMPQRLAEQNVLRAEKGLPPLPDPRDVTHGEPAVAPRDS